MDDDNEVLDKTRESNQTFQITEAHIQQLDDLIRGIQDKNSNNAGWFDDGNGIFFRCQRYEQRYLDCCKLQDHAFDFFQSSHMTGLIHLLKDSILSHRWTDAIKIVHTLAEDDSLTEITWKVGMSSMIMEKNFKSVDRHARQLCNNSKLTKVEVLFDYLLYLLTEGNFNAAQDLDLNLPHWRDSPSPINDRLKPLFHAYLGLVHYILWKEEIARDDTDDEETAVDYISQMLSQGHPRQHSQIKAEKAIHNFSHIRGIPGVWDIFIVKMLEIHEFYNELEAARSLLKEYQECNPDNLNAHRYLYMFEIKHEENNNELVLQCLQNITRLDPSNPLALKLYTELEPSHPNASILFDYLDFNHCKNNLKAWKLLKKHIRKVEGNNEKCKAVKRCWASRMDWWPHSSLQVNDDNENTEKLAKVKKDVHKKLKKHFSPHESIQS